MPIWLGKPIRQAYQDYDSDAAASIRKASFLAMHSNIAKSIYELAVLGAFRFEPRIFINQSVRWHDENDSHHLIFHAKGLIREGAYLLNSRGFGVSQNEIGEYYQKLIPLVVVDNVVDALAA